MFLNGPGVCSYNLTRWNLYSATYTPTVKMDGFSANYNPSSYESTIANRLAQPAYIDFDINFVGDSLGGIVFYSITAEQEPALSGPIKAWSVIMEDHEIVTTGWGGYYNQEMMWLPVAFPLGTQGYTLDFTGPYPQTISFMGSYTLNPLLHPIDSLNVTTFVQYATGTKEVLNANFMDLPDPATGVSGDESTPQSAELTVSPNPSNGYLSISAVLPGDESGNVMIYDITGRIVGSFTAEETVDTFIEETGVYFVRLTTESGETLQRQLTVIR